MNKITLLYRLQVFQLYNMITEMSEKQNEIMLAKHADVHTFLKEKAECSQSFKAEMIAYKNGLPKKKDEWTQEQRDTFQDKKKRSSSNRKFVTLLEEFEEYVFRNK